LSLSAKFRKARRGSIATAIDASKDLNALSTEAVPFSAWEAVKEVEGAARMILGGDYFVLGDN